MSTDLSPRYQVYLTYSNLAEMGNMYSTFLISDAALEVVSSKRIDAGIYEVIVKEYRPDQSENIYNATYTINTINMFKAEDAMRKKCGGDFCDGNIEAEISAKVNIQK